MKNEDLISIGKNIKKHRDDEIRFSPQYIATARANCTIAMGNIKRSSIVWLATTKNSWGIESQADNGDEITISKNTPLGGAIIMGRLGKHSYVVPKTCANCNLDIYNFAD